MEMALFWLLLITATGFRIVENDLASPSKRKHHHRFGVSFYSLTVGMLASSLIFGVLVLIAELCKVMAPGWAHDLTEGALTSLERWLPTAQESGSATALVITMGLILSFLISPGLTNVGRRLLKSRRCV
jgi:hypothetical protein